MKKCYVSVQPNPMPAVAVRIGYNAMKVMYGYSSSNVCSISDNPFSHVCDIHHLYTSRV